MSANAEAAAGPRTVVYVIASMVTGGTQTHLLEVLRSMDRSRFKPHLFCLRDDGDLIGAARGLEVGVESFSMAGGLNSPADLRGLVKMIIRLRRLRPSLLHAYLLRGNFYGAIAARAARVPAVVTSKRGLHRPAGAAERIAVAVANRFSDAILGNSPAVLDFYHRVESVPMERMVMIPSGIDTDRFSTANSTIENNLRRELGIDERPVVGAVTTFKEKKGFRTLFESFARVRRTVPGALLVVAGESALEGESARLAAELDITASLRLLGRRSDMPEILGAFDVFVLPSESEGMSNALLEAMAMGLPCVATAVGGNPTVIEDGISGFLVAPGDASGMAIQVRALFDDEARRKNVGSAARLRVVSKFSALSMVSQFEALYTRLCGQGGAQ